MSILPLPFVDALAYAVAEVPDDRARRLRPHGEMKPPPATPPPEDPQRLNAELLRRAAAGDQVALGSLYDRLSPALYATALRILREPAEAQDVVHDAFVALWEKATTYDPARGSAFAWAVTLVRHRAIDRLRMRRRRAALLAESAPADLGLEDESVGAVEAAGRTEEAAAVRAALAALPRDQQRALELAFFGGLTQEEIARSLAEPLGTVKARIRRGLLKLRDRLAPRL